MTRLLVIDDSEDDRDLFKRFLAASSWKIMETDNGLEGIELLTGSSIDCVLLDYSLPGHDGLLVLKSIREVKPLVPVIMLTGQGNEEIAASSIKEGAADYLVKSTLTPEGLKKSINNAISSGRLRKKVIEQKAELEQFARLLAHDLKQPANALNSMTNVILTKYAQQINHDLQNKLSIMADTSEQMVSLINALVSYTKLDLPLPNFELTDLNKCVTKVTNTLASDITQKKAIVHVDNLPKINAITSFISQLFQILIENSLKYCRLSPEIKISSITKSSTVEIYITDNGIGIPEHERERIFEPMIRLNNEYSGSGLGLATARRIVSKHKGSIHCTNNSLGGSCFVITLPTKLNKSPY